MQAQLWQGGHRRSRKAVLVTLHNCISNDVLYDSRLPFWTPHNSFRSGAVTSAPQVPIIISYSRSGQQYRSLSTPRRHHTGPRAGENSWAFSDLDKLAYLTVNTLLSRHLVHLTLRTFSPVGRRIALLGNYSTATLHDHSLSW